MATPPFVNYDPSLDGTGATIVGPNLRSAGNFTAAGTIAATGGMAGPLNVVATSATALTVARVGTTNPALAVSTAAASSVTGVLITAAAAGAGVTMAATSSGADEAFSVDSKGAGALALQATGTGPINVGSGLVIPKTGPAAVPVNTATDSVIGFFAGSTTVGQKLVSSGVSTNAAGIAATTGTALGTNRWSFTRIGNLVNFQHWARITPAAASTPAVVVTYDLSAMVTGTGGAIPIPAGGTFEAATAANGGATIGGQTTATQLATLSVVAAGVGTDVITVTINTTAAAAAIASEIFVNFWYDIAA